MKKILGTLTILALGILLSASSTFATFINTSGWDLVHDAKYHWMGPTDSGDPDKYATKVVHSEPDIPSYYVGDDPTELEDWVEVTEKVEVDPDDPKHASFEWSVLVDYYPDNKWGSSIHIPNPYNFQAVDDYCSGNTGGVDRWSFSQSGGYYVWELDTTNYLCNTYGLDGNTVYFKIELTNYAGYGISGPAYTDYCGNHDTYYTEKNWVVSHPTPEPATLFLIGTGLIGLAGYGWSRKKKQS